MMIVEIACTQLDFVLSTCRRLYILCVFFFFQAEDGIRDLVRSRGLGDVYKRQLIIISSVAFSMWQKIHSFEVKG